jgi:hypothetical protein
MTAKLVDIPGLFLGNCPVNTFPLLGSSFLIMQQLTYSNGRAVLSVWSAPSYYRQGASLVLSSVRECVKRGLAGGKVTAIVGAVSKKRLGTE